MKRVACGVRAPGVCVASGCSSACLCECVSRDVYAKDRFPLRNVFRWKTSVRIYAPPFIEGFCFCE